MDPYSDRQLVDETTHGSLVLCKTVLGNPATPTTTQIACQARIVALLDSLPAIRAFDRMPHARSHTAKNGDAKPSVDTDSQPLNEWQLLLDRCVAYRDLALAYRRTGDVHSAACNYRRATTLIQALLPVLSAPNACESDEAILSEDVRRHRNAMHSFATNTLIQALGDWADVERAIGRPTAAERLQNRANALRAAQ
ncbi:hypothetical protein IWW50_000077 [Coemansia erecta]|nr:hypothetical protein GGF43_000641 [Coemansia sp. RSA 2618]KAJ2830761.1 hypothetical protein IWW50_000077 [Coemansia erecta]